MGKKIKNKIPQISRSIIDLKKTLVDKKALAQPEKIVYCVYRGAENGKDKKTARKKNLRYDITHLFPQKLGKEIPKTFGHYHDKNYPEIMEIISGRAWFLIQRYEKNPKNIIETYLIEAGKGEKIIMLPRFGHISLNPTNKNLILANWLSTKEKSNYKPYEKLGGGCYYAIKTKNKIVFKKNKNYAGVPKLIKLKPKEVSELGITWGKKIYNLLNDPKKLSFLNEPEKFKKILTIKKCFKRI